MPTTEEYLSAAAKALKEHLTGPDYRQFKPEQAFINWYAKARYGASKNISVTDGSGDGGIDAVVTEHAARVIVQAKYEPSGRLRSVSQADLRQFENLARLIRDPNAQEEFDAWLERVRDNLKNLYRDLRRAATRDPQSVRFDFVTSKYITANLNNGLESVDIERIAPLWHLYEEGFTPPTERIDLEFEDLWFKEGADKSIRNYVGVADVRSFLSLMEHDIHERLFAQNVRTDLKTGLNRHIRETYESTPEDFWMGNNGIYVVCNKATRDGNSLRLLYPSIINGSQTLHSIKRSQKRHRCRILVRVLEMDLAGNQSLLSAIIKRTNSQNPMKPMNLAAHDREQLNVARYLDGAHVFYERREGEWQNEKKLILNGYLPVGMKDVAQWIAVTQGGVGIGSARAKVKELFQEQSYKRLFSRFGEDLSSQAYRRLGMAVVAALIVRLWIKKRALAQKGDARIVQLLLVRLVFEALEQSDKLQRAMKKLLDDRIYEAAVDGAVPRVLSAIVKSVVAEQRTYSRTREDLDLSNYFKRDSLTDPLYKKIAKPALIKELSSELETSLLDG